MLTIMNAFVVHDAVCWCQISVHGILVVAVVIILTKPKTNASDRTDMIV